MHREIKDIALKISATGSRVICLPPPTNTDEDYLVLAKLGEPHEILEKFDSLGYIADGDEAYEMLCEFETGGWCSFRKNHINYIVTQNSDFYDKFVLATEIAKRLNLLDKEDRIKLFQFMLYEADLGW